MITVAADCGFAVAVGCGVCYGYAARARSWWLAGTALGAVLCVLAASARHQWWTAGRCVAVAALLLVMLARRSGKGDDGE